MELLALHKAIKKPPRSDERDGELFCGTLEKIEFNGTTTFTTDSNTKMVLFLGGANSALAWTVTTNGITQMSAGDSGVSYFSGYSVTRIHVFRADSPATNTISPGQYGSASNPGIVYLIKE